MTNAIPSAEEINRITQRHVGPWGELTEEIDRVALRGIRLIRAMTQVDLAKAAEISQAYLSQLETGTRRYVGPAVYSSLIKALGVDYDDLLLTDEDDADDAADAA